MPWKTFTEVKPKPRQVVRGGFFSSPDHFIVGTGYQTEMGRWIWLRITDPIHRKLDPTHWTEDQPSHLLGKPEYNPEVKPEPNY